jgi:hypothetical protein
VWISVGNRFLYGYHAVTLPRHRGRGLHALSIHYAGKFLAAPQGKGMIAVLRAGNGKALVSEARVRRLYADAAVLWIGRRRVHTWMTRVCRAMNLRFTLGAPNARSIDTVEAQGTTNAENGHT